MISNPECIVHNRDVFVLFRLHELIGFDFDVLLSIILYELILADHLDIVWNSCDLISDFLNCFKLQFDAFRLINWLWWLLRNCSLCLRCFRLFSKVDLWGSNSIIITIYSCCCWKNSWILFLFFRYILLYFRLIRLSSQIGRIRSIKSWLLLLLLLLWLLFWLLFSFCLIFLRRSWENWLDRLLLLLLLILTNLCFGWISIRCSRYRHNEWFCLISLWL